MATEDREPDHRKTGCMTRTFDTSSEVTKKKAVRDINAEPEMIELKRMIRAGELSAARTITTIKGGKPLCCFKLSE